jgi:hypothetical protein
MTETALIPAVPAPRGRSYLLLQVAIALLLFVGFNFVLHRATRNSPPRALLRKIAESKGWDAVFLGSSIMEAGFNRKGFLSEAATPVREPLNLGLGSTHSVEHLLLLNHAVRKQPQMELCVIGFFDFELVRPAELPIDGNRVMAYYVEPEIAARLYYPNSWIDRALFPALGKIPVFTDRFSVWARVEKLRRSLSDILFAKPGGGAESNPFGRAADFQALETRSVDEFRANCNAYMRRPEFSPAVEEMLKTARAHARRTVIVAMPMSPHHWQNFYSVPEWPLFREHLRKLAASRGVEFIEAEDWVKEQSGFADNVHLSPEGAKLFSQRLARELGR